MKHKNQLTLARDYSYNSASGNYSYLENTLDNTFHSREQSFENKEGKRLLCPFSLNKTPGLIKFGLERFLHKYPNWKLNRK